MPVSGLFCISPPTNFILHKKKRKPSQASTMTISSSLAVKNLFINKVI